MNNAQKLADEALQVYRVTGLSPLEVLEDARKNKVDAECFRWWVHEASANPSLVAKAISHCITEDDYRQVICGAMEAKNAVIDAARKGKA